MVQRVKAPKKKARKRPAKKRSISDTYRGQVAAKRIATLNPGAMKKYGRGGVVNTGYGERTYEILEETRKKGVKPRKRGPYRNPRVEKWPKPKKRRKK